jgi:hypothetical protein
MGHIHKRFTDSQVKELLERYLKKEIERRYIESILGIGKARFFELVRAYRKSPDRFTVQYTRHSPTRGIDPAIEKNILKELAIDQKAIQNPQIPLKHYNYSYIRKRLRNSYRQKVSLWTVIDRARKHGFCLKDRRRKIHDREVLTHYVGELIQHDASVHLWAPAAKTKWFLITSLDDFSRYLLYALLVARETLWTHLTALQAVVTRWGFPYAYYVDCHSFFRYVKGRDTIPYDFHLTPQEYESHWKQILQECSIKPLYALSPQAKGKIERPYGWLQDHLIRTCIREDVRAIEEGNRVLEQEVRHYNHVQVHSTTGEIPYQRFQKALREKRSLFREFRLPPPLRSVKDLFCFRTQRFVDPYRRVTLHRLQLKVNGVTPRDQLTLRIYPLNPELSEVRFWREDQLVDVQTIRNEDLGRWSTFNP